MSVPKPDSVVIHLLDKEYRIACPEGERDNLLNAARLLDAKMRETRDNNVIGLERIAVMTALNMAHDLLLANQNLDRRSRDDNRIADLLAKVETEIAASSQS